MIYLKTRHDWERKLISKQGVSILFALLVLLVCASIGSVVLTAGTSAAGRVSKLSEADQRYYTVSSAAELFKDAFEGEMLEVVKTKTTVETETLSLTEKNGSYDSELIGRNSSDNYEFQIKQTDPLTNTAAAVAKTDSIPIEFGAALLLADDVSDESIYDKDFPVLDSAITKEYTLEHVFSDSSLQENAAKLNANVVCRLDPGGKLLVRISSPRPENDVDFYTMELSFQADIQEHSGRKQSPEQVEIYGDASPYTQVVTNTVQEYKSYVLEWNFVKAEVVNTNL